MTLLGPKAALLALMLAATPSFAHPKLMAQSRPLVPTPQQKPLPEAPPSGSPSLKERTGVSVATQLVASESLADRRLGLERLGDVGTPRALELLVRSLEHGGAARSPEERLIATRALSRHARHDDVQRALVRIMTGVRSLHASQEPDPLEQLVQHTAALALSASGQPLAFQALGRALRHEGRAAQAAALAVLAHPPRSLEPILNAGGAPTLVLVELLEQLGDQRAFTALREFVKRAEPSVRLRAAIALTRLGDFETVELARYWFRRDRDPAVQLAAAEILAIAHAPDAPGAIAKLLAADATRERALELALAAPHPELVAPLDALLNDPNHPVESTLSALARAASSGAVRVLARELAGKRRAAAAYALALCRSEAALEQIERAVEASANLRIVARAAVVRRLAFGDDVDGLQDLLERLLVGAEAANRATGAWGLAALSPARAVELLDSPDRVVVAAVARQAFSGEAAVKAAARLVREKDPELRTALAASLASDAAAERVPTRLLLELIETPSAAIPLLVKAIASRDSNELRPRITAFLNSSDPQIRAHAAFGLAHSKDSSAVGLLAGRYRFETAAEVRRAIVAALSQRHEPARKRTLRLAQTLDPDPAVRQSAGLALGGQRIAIVERGKGALWTELVERPDATVARWLIVTLPSGVSLPALRDPDSLLVMARLPEGPIGLRLAAGPRRGKVQRAAGVRAAETSSRPMRGS